MVQQYKYPISPAKPPCPECGGTKHGSGFKHEEGCSLKYIRKTPGPPCSECGGRARGQGWEHKEGCSKSSEYVKKTNAVYNTKKRKAAKKKAQPKGKPEKIDGELILEATAEAEAMSLQDIGAIAFNWGRMKGKSIEEVGEKYVDDLCSWIENKGLETKHAKIYQIMLRYLSLLGNPHERVCDIMPQQPASAISRRGQHKKYDPIDDCPKYLDAEGNPDLNEFRKNELLLENGTKYGDAMELFQKERFWAWDNKRRNYCESCTGSSKTTDIAAWCISQLYKDKYFEGTIYAVDTDQAKKISNAAKGFINRNIRLQGWLEVDRSGRIKRVTKGKKGKTDEVFGEIVVDSSDEASAEGLITDAVICEQIESWRNVGLWEAIISRAHKRQMKVIVIANACYDEEDWQFKNVREMARKSERWHFIEIGVHDVKWITEEDIQQAKESLRPATYERLYENKVGAAEGTMFTPEQVERMLDPKRGAPLRSVMKKPLGILRVALGLDIGFVGDPTSLCAIGEDANGDQQLLNMRVWQGKKGKIEDEVDYEDVISTFREYIGLYMPDKLVYDPHEFRGVAQAFHREFVSLLHPFYFGVATVTELTKQLYRRGVDGRLTFYPHAGESLWKGRVISFTIEMKSVKMKETQYGYRIEKKTKKAGVDRAPTKDRVISVGMASWWLSSTFVAPIQEHISAQDEQQRPEDYFLGKRMMDERSLGDLDI